VLVRPDQHVAWRAEELSENPEAELTGCLPRSCTAMRHARPGGAVKGMVMEAHEQGFFTEENSADVVIGRNAKARMNGWRR
jgi:hypothetical protein